MNIRSFARMLSALVLAGCVWLYGHSSALAATKEPPKTCRMGVYVTGLRDFDLIKESFTTDFWIWAVCPSKELKPLESLEFINAKDVKTAFDAVLDRKDKFGEFSNQDKVAWFQKKVAAQLSHTWDVRSFPFDRHQLQILIEEALNDTSTFVYTPDTKNSTYKKDLKVEGWNIKNFSIRGEDSTHNTTFGDPELQDGQSTYSRLVVSIDIQRNSVLSFFKLHAVVYIGFILALASLFLNPGQTSLMGGKISAPVGSLFAVVVNQRAAEAILGRSEELTLTDQIHITAMAYILLTIIIAIYSRIVCERGNEKQAIRLNTISFYIAGISFCIVNAILIIHAAIVG